MKGRAMKDSLKKGLIIGAAGSAICVLWHHLLTKKMMQLAMDRVAPQDRSNGKMRVSGSPEMIETTEIVKKAAGQLEKSGCDVVEITAHDGISLIGHWCPCEEPKRTIVAMHGWRSSWSHDFGLIADFWRNNHCSVLYAEQRGQNNSGGDHMSLGLLERYDCLAWTNWINEKTGKSIPIYLAGVSMGATSVLMASELELPIMYLESQRTVHLLRSMQFGNMSPKAICIFLMLCIKQVPIGCAKSASKWMLMLPQLQKR